MHSFAVPQRFELLRQIGEGGMGVVFEAHDRERNELVALKTLRNVTPHALARFKREFRALSDLHHPNLVSLGELISEGPNWFFTMELVEGCDFVQYVRRWEPPERNNSPSAQTIPAPDSKASPATPVVAQTGQRVVAGRFEEARLRPALAQLASALEALHAAHKVHRDIKPSNIRVTHAGRVVLLDFGLVIDMVPDLAQSMDAVVGTPSYMAPEQASAGPVGPEADWYSVGVLLYEALTGLLPFTGNTLQVLLAKQREEPPSPRAIDPTVPPDLDALCTHLLRIDPRARMAGRDLLRTRTARSGDAPTAEGAPSHASQTQTPPFVGRDAELALLQTAWETARRGAAVSVVVTGESGQGKSGLVRHFVGELLLREPPLVVLAGRCYEKETVPYKAFDGIVDALTRFMMRQPRADAAGLLPRRAATLTQLFPVFRRVDALAAEPLREVAADPQELRGRAFSAMRELLARLAERRPLVLVIDDLQWADDDSLALLGEVLRPPDPPALLLVATIRSAAIDESDGAVRVRKLPSRIPGDVRQIALSRLSDAQALELSTMLLQRVGVRRAGVAEAIVKEAEGHPLFLEELVQHCATRGEQAPTRLRLEDALWSRVQSLEEPARRVVELAAVAGAPVAQDVLAAACGLELGTFTTIVSVLRVSRLVRTNGTRSSDAIETYHDRVRDAVRGHLTPAQLRDAHGRIALAMETVGRADPSPLAVHWLAAGDRANAARFALAAAEAASSALAFDRAAYFYEMALAVADDRSTEERRELTIQLGESLAKAGRGAAAAERFQIAAAGARAAEALDLRRRAAEQLLRSGHFDRGITEIRAVLRMVGMSLTERPLSTLVMVIFWRLVIRLRGLGYRTRDETQVSARELTRIDVGFTAAVGLALIDHVRGAVFQARQLLLALRAGEPYRIARALASETSYSGAGGGRTWKRTSAIMTRALALSEKTGHPHAIGLSTGAAGIAMYLAGRYKECVELCDRGQLILRERCAGSAWETATAQMFALNGLFFQGQIVELSRRVPQYLREAIDRGDLYAAVNFRIGFPNFVWLAADEPARARAEVETAMRQWSTQGFHVEHYYELVALTAADLYDGNAFAGYERICARWPALRRSLLLRIQSVRLFMHLARARCALGGLDRGDRETLLRVAEKDARLVATEKMPWATPSALLVMAAVARHRGDGARAARLLDESIAGFDAAGMALYATVARRYRGLRAGGAAGDRERDAAERWMSDRMMRRPDRVCRVIAPGFD